MLGLVLFMMDQNRREAEACLEAAYVNYQVSNVLMLLKSVNCCIYVVCFFSPDMNSYMIVVPQKCGASCARYATRAALWLAEVHKSRFQFKEAAAVYFRASTEVAAFVLQA